MQQLNPNDPLAAAEALKLSALSLQQLVAGAKLRQQRIGSVKGRVAKVRAATLANACSLGHYLLAIKRRVPHGQFASWIKRSNLEVSQKTSERYMSLAVNSTHVSNLPSGTSLRKAYISLGIVRRAKPASFEKGLMDQILKLCRFITAVPKDTKLKDKALLKQNLLRLQCDCATLIQLVDRKGIRRRKQRQRILDHKGSVPLLPYLGSSAPTFSLLPTVVL